MSDDANLDRDDLEAQDGQLLANRELMSVVQIEPDPLLEPDTKTYEVSPEDPPPGT